jgi:uncharacterized protein (TIGR04255 family)
VLEFQPIFPAHAIERCTATLVFDQALPAKLFERVRAAEDKRLLGLGLVRGPQPIGFSFDLQTGRVVTVEGDAKPIPYTTQDQSITVTIMNNQVSLVTVRYVRWQQFRSALSKYLVPTISIFLDTISIGAIQLDYSDRFFWTGNWQDFDVSGLLKRESELFAHRAGQGREQWHSHAGWLQDVEPGIKRLINVNIDVVNAQLPSSLGVRPSVGIWTSVRDASGISGGQNSSWIPEEGILDMLDRQHVDLKEIFRGLVVTEISKKIGL